MARKRWPHGRAPFIWRAHLAPVPSNTGPHGSGIAPAYGSARAPSNASGSPDGRCARARRRGASGLAPQCAVVERAGLAGGPGAGVCRPPATAAAASHRAVAGARRDGGQDLCGPAEPAAGGRIPAACGADAVPLLGRGHRDRVHQFLRQHASARAVPRPAGAGLRAP